jgi:hypothetical protein
MDAKEVSDVEQIAELDPAIVPARGRSAGPQRLPPPARGAMRAVAHQGSASRGEAVSGEYNRMQ